MDLSDLRLLLQVVEEGSFQGTANKLGLARTTLRRRIDNLEAVVGAPILMRGSHGVRLTAAGEVIVRQGRALLAHSETMLTQALASEHDAITTIRMVIPLGMPNLPRLAAITNLRAAYPEVCIDVRELEDPLTAPDGTFELMILLGQPAAKNDWFSRVLLRPPMRVLASPSYLEQHGSPRSIEQLGEHQILMWRGPGRPIDAWPLTGGGTVRLRPWLTSTNLVFLLMACARGKGLLLAPPRAAMAEPGVDPLVTVLDDLVADELVVRALSPHPSSVDSRVRTIVTNLQSTMAQLSALTSQQSTSASESTGAGGSSPQGLG